jgi:HAD superfamily hydrolase (TIGR01549 family)
MSKRSRQQFRPASSHHFLQKNLRNCPKNRGYETVPVPVLCLLNDSEDGVGGNANRGLEMSGQRPHHERPMRPSALLFDMDGTLTEPMLDFPAIKAEMGIGTRPILEALAEMNDAQRERAHAILHRHEEIAAANSTLNPGCEPLLHWIEAQQIPLALITRNSRRSVDVVLERHGLKIDVLVTRDDGIFKPDPRPLLLACQRLGVSNIADAWMIGDGRYDVEAGLAARMKTVWLSHARSRDFPAQPWKSVSDLHELLNVLVAEVSNGP